MVTRVFWTRRGVLAVLAAAGLAPALPAMPGDDGLRDICRRAAVDPFARALGHAHAAATGAGAVHLEARLRARLPAEGASNWEHSLVAAASEDLARGQTVMLLGRRLSLTEADTLAIGASFAAQA